MKLPFLHKELLTLLVKLQLYDYQYFFCSEQVILRGTTSDNCTRSQVLHHSGRYEQRYI